MCLSTMPKGLDRYFTVQEIFGIYSTYRTASAQGRGTEVAGARGDAEHLCAFQTGKRGQLHRRGVGRPRPDGLLTSRPSTSRSAVRLADPVSTA